MKKPGHVANLNSSPRLCTPLTVRNMAMGDPRAKKLDGLNSSCGYLTKGTPVPACPTTRLTAALWAVLMRGSLHGHGGGLSH